MILLVALLAFCSAGHSLVEAGDNPAEPQNGSFWFEIFEHRLQSMQSSVSQLFTSLVHVEETRAENQRLMLEQLLSGLSKQTTNRIIGGCDEVDSSGRFRLRLPEASATFGVICEAGAFDGGWLVIQQRLSGKLSFDQGWEAYRQGFGIVGTSSDFWLGLEKIHWLTRGDDYELAVELRNEAGTYGFALHSKFEVAGEEEMYRLTCSGTEAGTMDGRIGAGDGEMFTTKDFDYDKLEEVNCGEKFKSGWWFYDCNNVNLNGPFKKDNVTGRGIYWRGFTEAATYSRMMIRRK